MGWPELIEAQLVVSMDPNNFSFWNFLAQFSNGLEQDWLISSFEIFMLLTVEECDEIWNGLNSICLSAVSGDLSIYCDEYQIWIFIALSSTFKCWFDPHARWARWTPEVDDNTGCLFDDLLENLER